MAEERRWAEERVLGPAELPNFGPPSEPRPAASIELPPGEELVLFSRWITPAVVATRFDARFFLALAPAHTPPEPDGAETVEARWLEPKAALEATGTPASSSPATPTTPPASRPGTAPAPRARAPADRCGCRSPPSPPAA